MSDRKELFEAYGQRWSISWCAKDDEPLGTRHGSAGICMTPTGEALLVSEDGTTWDLPGGRSEGIEDWRATLHREVREEGCALVDDATLLGFARSECVEGPEAGTVLVRSLWRATVQLLPWDPKHEISERRLVGLDELARTSVGGVPDWFLKRWIVEAQTQ